MKISKSKTLTVNMGNYESFRFGASVEVSHCDVGMTDEEMRLASEEKVAKVLHDFAAGVLEELLVEDVREAAELTEERKSFVLAALQPPKPRKKKE